MTASMAKKVSQLEATFWAKAEVIKPAWGHEVLAYAKELRPFDSVVFNAWLKDDAEAAKITRRIEQMEKSLPPIHPAFLPDYADKTRRFQWGFHWQPDYLKLVEKQWRRFLDYGRARYDVKDGGLLGIVLRLYEKDIDKWIAQRGYMGLSGNREEMAADQIELWTTFRRLCEEADEPEDHKTREGLWQQATIENIFNLHGREMTEADLKFDQKMWAQLDEDIAAGKPASESEAAAYLRRLFERHPHKVSSYGG